MLREMFRFSGTFYPRSNPELWLGSVRSRSKLALRIQEDFHSNVLQRKGDFEAQDGRVANDSNAVLIAMQCLEGRRHSNVPSILHDHHIKG